MVDSQIVSALFLKLTSHETVSFDADPRPSGIHLMTGWSNCPQSLPSRSTTDPLGKITLARCGTPGPCAVIFPERGRRKIGIGGSLLQMINKNPRRESSASVPNGTFSRSTAEYLWWMRMGDLNPKLVLAVPCPTCGVAAGEGCALHSGQPRNDPHLDRKLRAIESLESRRAPATGGRSISDQNMSKWIEVIERGRNRS